jgi:hypothetical protein
MTETAVPAAVTEWVAELIAGNQSKTYDQIRHLVSSTAIKSLQTTCTHQPADSGTHCVLCRSTKLTPKADKPARTPRVAKATEPVVELPPLDVDDLAAAFGAGAMDPPFKPFDATVETYTIVEPELVETTRTETATERKNRLRRERRAAAKV